MKKQYKTPPTHFVIVAHFFLGGLVLATIVGTIVSVIVTGVLSVLASLVAPSLNIDSAFLSEQISTYGFFAMMVFMAPVGAKASAKALRDRYRILLPDKVALYSTWLLIAYLVLPWLIPGHAPLTWGTITSTGTDGDAILHLVAAVVMIASQFAIAYTFYLASKKFLAAPRTR